MSTKGYSGHLAAAAGDGKDLYWTAAIDQELPARVSDAEMADGWVAPMTVTGMLHRTVGLRGNNVALRVMRDKEYTWTWKEYLATAPPLPEVSIV